ncbi:hypothetical protein N7456_002292 [Penicillium angulare]|uniref:AB hydrolase-1 domain-containing protein n=1 Tax=Penicillium angulare TaxID=116970 RepID=A0A9W9KQ64_9EURO|nr:hypothetical protein N7456_002292 [Penicillium angulare]
MASALPTIAIIIGAWQNTENYEPLRQVLSSRGYDTVCRSPPSTSSDHGDTDLAADSAFVHEEILRPLVEDGKEVIVVVHSFGGVYGGGALKGLSRSERAQSGNAGGIVAVVYLAAACIPSGVTTLQAMGIGEELLPWVELDKSTGLLSVPDPIPLLFHNLPPEVAHHWAAKMKHQAIKPMQSVVTYAPFEDEMYKGHLAYLKCLQDEMIHLPGQLKFLSLAGIEVTDEMDASHMPWLDNSDETAMKLLRLVEKVRM